MSFSHLVSVFLTRIKAGLLCWASTAHASFFLFLCCICDWSQGVESDVSRCMSVFVVRILLFYIVCIFLIFSKIEATLSKVMSVIADVCLFFPLWLPQWPHKESVHDPGSIIVLTIEEAEISTLFDLWMFVLIVKVLITLTTMVIIVDLVEASMRHLAYLFLFFFIISNWATNCRRLPPFSTTTGVSLTSRGIWNSQNFGRSTDQR